MATLAYRYADSVVWLDDLAGEDHPMTHDLCSMHAAGIRVPRGWRLEDGRASQAAPVGGVAELRLVGA